MTQDASRLSPLYDTLDTEKKHIRLLTIAGSLNNSLIDCRLSTAALTAVKYVVLSYRWGSSGATHEILLNGYSFYVRQNLWNFLNVIREQPGMMLWIDALCIDQHNIEERSKQVRIMGQIFQSAAMVLSWLGPENAKIEQAFDLMSRVWSLSNVEDQSDNLPTMGTSDSENDLWEVVEEVCSLQYWSRVWVVQEILLSSNNYLLCGTRSLPWQVFANFISLIDVRFHCPPHHSRTINDSMARSYAVSKPYAMVRPELQWRIGNELRHDYGKGWDTEEHNCFRILTMFGERECADPLDHVYALLSLSDEGNTFPIKYGIDNVHLFLTVFHFCGQSAFEEYHTTSPKDHFEPTSQRAFMRNSKFLAETLEVIPAYQKTLPYFHGTATSSRGPSPRPDPCFPCAGQTLRLQCTAINPGDEPPVLRSNSLQRSVSTISSDLLLHLDESQSWLMCRRQEGQTNALVVVAIITIKDSPRGRGFKILEPGRVARSTVEPARGGNVSGKWYLDIPTDAHLDLLKIVILGVQAAL